MDSGVHDPGTTGMEIVRISDDQFTSSPPINYSETSENRDKLPEQNTAANKRQKVTHTQAPRNEDLSSDPIANLPGVETSRYYIDKNQHENPENNGYKYQQINDHNQSQNPNSMEFEHGFNEDPAIILSAFNGYEACLEAARNLLIKAAHQAPTKHKQTKVLDYLQEFRECLETESGPSRFKKSLDTQLQRIEQTTRILETSIQKQVKPNVSHSQSRVPNNLNMDKTQNTYNRNQEANTLNDTEKEDHANLKPATYASILAKNNKMPAGKTQDWVTVEKKKHETRTRICRRLILLMEPETEAPVPVTIRDNINRAFKDKGVSGPVIALVSITTNNNVALTTTHEFSADFLLEQQEVWAYTISYREAIKDVPWYKVIIHGLNISYFGNDLSTFLPEEIELYNRGLKVIGQPFWATSQDRRQVQEFGSAVVAFSTEAEMNQAVSRRLTIGGQSLRAEKFLSVSPSSQCQICQGFGHHTDKCRNKMACKFCGKDHLSKDHLCSQCGTKGRPCSHLIPYCVNCKKSHQADTKSCEIREYITSSPRMDLN